MKNIYTSHMIISSSTIVICSLINFIFALIRKTLSIFNSISEIAESGADYTTPETWTSFFITAANIKAVFTLSFGTLSILQFICGLLGIMLIILFFANKYINKIKHLIIILIIIGIITSILSSAAYLLLILIGKTSFLTCFIMLFTMPAISVIFTQYTKKFYIEYKKNLNTQYNNRGN